MLWLTSRTVALTDSTLAAGDSRRCSGICVYEGGRLTESPLRFHPDPVCRDCVGEPRLAPTVSDFTAIVTRSRTNRRVGPAVSSASAGDSQSRHYDFIRIRFAEIVWASQGSPLQLASDPAFAGWVGDSQIRPYINPDWLVTYSYSSFSSFQASARASMTASESIPVCMASRMVSLTEAAQGPHQSVKRGSSCTCMPCATISS